MRFNDKVKTHKDAKELFEKFLYDEWWEITRQNFFKNGVNKYKLSYDFEYFVRFGSWGARSPENGKDFNRGEIDVGGIWQDKFEKS